MINHTPDLSLGPLSRAAAQVSSDSCVYVVKHTEAISEAHTLPKVGWDTWGRNYDRVCCVRSGGMA